MMVVKTKPVIYGLHKLVSEVGRKGQHIDYVEIIGQYRNNNIMDDSDVMKFLFERFCDFISHPRSVIYGDKREEIMETLKMSEGCYARLGPQYVCCECCNVPTTEQMIDFNNAINAVEGEYALERQDIINTYKSLFP